MKEDYAIKKLTVLHNGKKLFSLRGKKLVSYFMSFDDVSYTIQNELIEVHAQTDDSRIFLQTNLVPKSLILL